MRYTNGISHYFNLKLYFLTSKFEYLTPTDKLIIHMKHNQTFRIIIFFLIATVFSNLFRFETFGFGKILNQYPIWIKITSVPLQSIAIFVGALIGLKWLGSKQKIAHSFFGSSSKWSLLMAVLPIVLLGVIGIENSHGFNTHLLGFVIGVILLIYCIFEEYGWRGYLEEELKGKKEWLRVLIIALLWYTWHLPFIENLDLMSNLKFIGIMLLGSWGIGKIIQTTHSVLAAACFHMLYSIMILQIKDEVYLALNNKLLIIGICVVVWIIMLQFWKREKTNENKLI